MLPSGFLSEDKSKDRTPLSKRMENIQAQDAVLPKKNPVIDIPESPEPKKRPVEGVEPSSSKKQKIARKSEAAALTLMETDNFDDFVDDIDLDASDYVRFPCSRNVRLYVLFFFRCIFSRSPQALLGLGISCHLLIVAFSSLIM